MWRPLPPFLELVAQYCLAKNVSMLICPNDAWCYVFYVVLRFKEKTKKASHGYTHVVPPLKVIKDFYTT